MADIDLSALPESVLNQIESLVQDHNKRAKWKLLLDEGTEEEIIECARKECVTNDHIVLASKYKANEVPRILYCPIGFMDHPRRPVAMRGSLAAMIMRRSASSFTCANGLADDILERFIRFKKVTAFTQEEFDEVVKPAIDKLRQKFSTSYHFPRRWGGWLPIWSYSVVIKGRVVIVDEHQRTYLNRLFSIIRKTDVLEERVKLLRLKQAA